MRQHCGHNTGTAASYPRGRCRPGGSPRLPPLDRSGAVLVLVLVLTSLAVTYAYTALRMQGVHQAVTCNLVLSYQARQAAISGTFLALKHMHHSWWGGADTSFSQPVDEQSVFTAVFRTGDARLSPASSRWAEYPFRLTVEVRGQSVDSSRPGVVATAGMRMVTRLVPRQVSPAPSGWGELTSFTLCQWRAGTCLLQTPCRFEGLVRIRDRLDLANAIAWSAAARWDYLQGLRLLRQSVGDFRPFNSAVYLPYARQDSGTISLLMTALGVLPVDSSVASAFSWVTLPRSFGYTLYPGSRVYTGLALGEESLKQSELGADPLTNPLAIFVRERDLELGGDVRLVGTLFLRGGKSSLKVVGLQNLVSPPIVPPYGEPVQSSELRVRLPAVVTEESLVVHSGGELSGTGIILVQKDFVIRTAPQDPPKFAWVGGVAATNFRVEPRAEWDMPEKWWDATYTTYRNQAVSGDRNFARWLENNAGLKYRPRIVVTPANDRAQFQWFMPPGPLFVPHPADTTPLEPGRAGLRWEVLAASALPPE